MIPEAAMCMLACARVGAIHSVVFAGFSAMALKDRILDARSKLILTADQGVRGAKKIELKQIVDESSTSSGEEKSEKALVETNEKSSEEIPIVKELQDTQNDPEDETDMQI